MAFVTVEAVAVVVAATEEAALLAVSWTCLILGEVPCCAGEA